MSKKLTQEEFICKAKKIHGNKYDYSLVDYKDIKKKVEIICTTHEKFSQSAELHLSGSGCPKCAGKNKTTEKFIKESKIIHENKYDYSLVEYVGSESKVKIICPIHGIFEQTPRGHLYKYGCSKCAKNVKMTIADFIKKANKVHSNKYDYSFAIYKNSKTNLNISCPIHGIFKQTPYRHLSGSKCPRCVGGARKTTEEFVEDAKKIHGNRYDYSLVDYKNNKTKINIICHIHGEFFQTPSDHLSGNECPICSLSKGEKKINDIFKKNNIIFIPQKKFNNCILKRELPFDCYLSEIKCCIEFHGEQHFRPIEFFERKCSFSNQQKKDKIKERYCKLNKIPLIIAFKKDSSKDKFFFVDLYDNFNKDIIKIFLKEGFAQCSIKEYELFKNNSH